MSRRFALVAASVPLLALLAMFAWPSRPGPKSVAPTATADAPPPQVASPALPAARRAARRRYRISSSQHAVLGGREQASVVVEGTWTTIERAGGLTEASFAASRIEVVGDQAPSAAEMAGHLVLASDDGVLAGIGFAERTPRAARALLTGLATTFQSTTRPGASWTVEEEDLLGCYLADYHRSGARVTRQRARYTALRDAGGLSPARAASLLPTEASELRFDEQGLVSATIRSDAAVTLGQGLVALELSLSATLEREAADEVPLEMGPGYEVSKISDHLDRVALARSRDEALVAGQKAPALLADAREAARLDRTKPGAREKRDGALRRLTALTQLDPRAATAIAESIRREPGDPAVGLLLGALSSSSAQDATGALTSLLAGEPLPDELRGQVFTHLTLAQTPTPESAAALTRELAGPSGDQAALALGAQARGLADAPAAEEAIDQLLARHAQATTPDQKRQALLALANSGSDRVLDVMVSTIRGPDLDLARLATHGLRHIPGDEVDALLWVLIEGGSPLLDAALQAVAYRSALLWRPRLEAAREHFASEPRVLDMIKTVLSRWALPDPGP